MKKIFEKPELEMILLVNETVMADDSLGEGEMGWSSQDAAD